MKKNFLSKYILPAAIAVTIILLLIYRPLYLYKVLASLFPLPQKTIIDKSEFIKYNDWEYRAGYKINKGDFIIFNNEKCPECNYFLHGDTIFYKSDPQAIIVWVTKNEIVVRSIDKGKLGSYVEEDGYYK